MQKKAQVTLVNIVGLQMQKKQFDHLAVYAHVWLMIVIVVVLHESQQLGDYVLAHAYLRDDHILDDVLPPDIPIHIAETACAL